MLRVVPHPTVVSIPVLTGLNSSVSSSCLSLFGIQEQGIVLPKFLEGLGPGVKGSVSEYT